MSDILTLFPLEFNASIRIEARPERLTSEPGALVLCEAIERTRIVEWLVGRLHDPCNPDVPDGLASQPTLSHLGRALASDGNRAPAGSRSGARPANPLSGRGRCLRGPPGWACVSCRSRGTLPVPCAEPRSPRHNHRRQCPP